MLEINFILWSKSICRYSPNEKTPIISGIRQEQDIFVRLIDSATKTVSPFKMKMIHKCCWFWKKLPFEDLSCWWQWDQSQRDERRPGVSIFRALPSARTLPHNRAHIAAHHNSGHNAAHHNSLSPQPQPCHLWTTKYQSRHPHNSPSPSPVLQTAKYQRCNDLCPQIFFTATCYFPPCRFGSSELKCIPRWNTRCALIFVARVGVPDPALFTRWNMFGARWCTSAVTKAEIRPRAPQLWHKLGAKKYCWRDLAVFQRRFEKTLTKRLFQVVEYEGSNHIKNPEMQRVLLTHEVICR